MMSLPSFLTRLDEWATSYQNGFMAMNHSDHWSDYWSRGSLTSLPQDFAANYDGEVAGFWQQVFRGVPEQGRIIDLCTGNGAIALLAAEYARKVSPGLEITAVDAATISPESIAQKYPGQAELLQRIRFIGNCRVEEMNLPPAGFDLVTSQYGIEYCDWTQAAAQVERVLRPGGRLVLVSHTATSDIMKFMAQEQREYAQLERLGFFRTIKGFLDNGIDFERFRKTLATTQATLARELGTSDSPLFRSVLGMVGGVLNMNEPALDKSRTHLQAYYAQTRHGYDRLTDMLRVNQAIQSQPHWYRVFESAGLKLTNSGEIQYRGRHHAGDFYSFEKPVQSGT